MGDSDFRDSAGLPPPAWGSPSEAPAGQADIQRPANDPSSAYQCGLASLLVGCTVGLASGLVIILATILFYGGPRGMPVVLAFATGLISVLVVAAASIGSVIRNLRLVSGESGSSLGRHADSRCLRQLRGPAGLDCRRCRFGVGPGWFLSVIYAWKLL